MTPTTRIRPLVLLLALLSITTPNAVAQDPPDPAALDLGGNESEIRGLVVLRISEELLDRLLATDIDKHTSVDMCVVGIRSKGLSHTSGAADVQPKPDRDDAAFQITIKGDSRAQTTGRSGPAIVDSRSVTNWKVDKVIRFEEGKFITLPGTIQSNTSLAPAHIRSTLPGLRGSLIRRIGSNRERQLRPAATRSVNRQTSENVLAEVDKSIDEKIEKLNNKIESRTVLERLLPLLDSKAVQMSTNRKCIHLAFLGMDNAAGVICPLDRLDPAETELWINTSLLPTPVPALPEVPGTAVEWIGEQLTEMKLPQIPIAPQAVLGGELPLQMQVVDDWIVLRTESPEPVAPAK